MTDEQKLWTLKDIYDDLVSRQDLPRALNVTPRRFVGWLDRREDLGCPMPIKRLGHVDIYSLQEWKDWYERFLAAREHKRKVMEASPHGHGEAFWSYFEQERNW